MGVVSVITYLANMVPVKFPKHIRLRSYRDQNPESDVILRDSELYPIMLFIPTLDIGWEKHLAKISSTTQVQMLQWLHGKQQHTKYIFYVCSRWTHI